MKLFLHVGTEKTGSSHIQTVSVTGRAHLQYSGIWFPEGIPRHEARMRVGLVSAGNGCAVAQLAREGNYPGVETELGRYLEAAQARGCWAVFLTSELLLPYIADGNAWNALFSAARQVGFAEISILIVLRDPVDQLLSLYKHRARSGTAGRIDEWLASGDRLACDLQVLRESTESAYIEFRARGYTRKSGGLEGIFFDDWLGVSTPQVAIGAEVNPSLTLSELEFLRQMNNRCPELVPILHQKLAGVPRKAKVQGSALEAHARAVAEKVIWENREEWRRWNDVLSDDERLDIPAKSPDVQNGPKEVEFSVRQIEALVGFMAESAQLKFIARLWWRARVRPFLGKMKRLFCRTGYGKSRAAR